MSGDLKQFNWLIGKWEGKHGDGVYHEEWWSETGGQIHGSAYISKNGSIGETEILKLHLVNGIPAYTADVKHNPKPVSFLLTFSDEHIFVFENPQHDFPQKITYERINDNSLIATIEAISNEAVKQVKFMLNKIS